MIGLSLRIWSSDRYSTWKSSMALRMTMAMMFARCLRCCLSRSGMTGFSFRLRGLAPGEPGEPDRRSIWKFGNQRQLPAERLHVTAQRRQQEVRTLLEARHPVLPNAELPGQALLGELARAPELPE